MRDRPTDIHRTIAGMLPGDSRIVHHRDEDKTNNSPANLEPEDRAVHTAAHNKARGLSKLRKALRTTQGKEDKLY